MSSTENSRWSTSLCLLNEVRNGHTEGWQKFLHLYTPLLMAWCRKAKLQDADTSDVCQEVFQAVMAGIGRVKCGPGYSFRGWLWTITQRSLARHFQEQKASPKVHGGTDAQRRMNVIPDWVDDDSAPESEAADAEVIRRAAEIIRADFEERTWQAFWMSTVENVPPAEIAAQLGMTTNSIRQARFRVLARLREFVGFW